MPGFTRYIITLTALWAAMIFAGCGREGDEALRFQMEKSLNRADREYEQIKVKGPVLSDTDLKQLEQSYASIAAMVEQPRDAVERENASEDKKQAWSLASLAVTRIGGLYLERKIYDKAYDFYRIVAENRSTTQLQKNSVVSYMALALEKMGRFSEAAALYDSLSAGYLLVLTPENPNLDALDAPLKAAEMWKRAGENNRYAEALERARNYYDNLAAGYPGTLISSAAAGKSAASFLQQDRFEEAIAVLRTVRDDSTGKVSPGVILMIAEIYMDRLGDFDSAGKTYREFIETYPRHKDIGKARLGQGFCLYQQTRYVEARKALEGIERLTGVDQKTVAQAFYLVALSYEKEDKWELAKGQYDIIEATFLGMDEGYDAALHVVEYYRTRGLDDLAQKAFESALAYINKNIRQTANNPEACARAIGYLVRAYTENGELEKAAEQLVLLHDRYPQFPEGRLAPLRLADIYENVLKDNGKAADWLKTFVDENPNEENLAGLRAHIADLEAGQAE